MRVSDTAKIANTAPNGSYFPTISRRSRTIFSRPTWKAPQNGKAGRLGTTGLPLSPPGCGISKPWGVWEGASMKRPGEPPADYLNFVCRSAVGSSAQSVKTTHSSKERTPLIDQTVANRWPPCHLQICISWPVRCFYLLTNFKLAAIQDRRKRTYKRLAPRTLHGVCRGFPRP